MSGHAQPNSEPSQQPLFREIEPIPQWSARIAVDVPYENFLSTVLALATETQHRYGGTLTRDPITSNVTSFTHTRFRRNKYGPPTNVSECEEGMRKLGREFGAIHEREALSVGLSRVVLGLYKGQHATGSRAELDSPDYSVDHVRTTLGADFRVHPEEVFSTRLQSGDAAHYAEDVATVIFPTVLKRRVYTLGHAMMQERFSVEDFVTSQSISYMVETEWCREPDPVQL